ncbi:MAG: tetratricopeptide repeat protein [Lutibacter sp.]
MKNLGVIFLLFTSSLLFAQSPTELFKKGNESYKSGDYLEALISYKKIEANKLQSDVLYFNMGNCYYKLNKIARSVYYYEKALQLNPENIKAKENLAFAKRMTIDAIDKLPQSIFQKFSKSVIQKYSFDTWAILAIIASFLIAISFLIYYFSYSSGKKLFFFNTAIIAFIIMIFSLFFAYENYKYVKNHRVAVIFDKKVAIKDAPSTNSDAVFELHEGTTVLVLDELDNWKKIKIADGKTGWVDATAIKEIND